MVDYRGLACAVGYASADEGNLTVCGKQVGGNSVVLVDGQVEDAPTTCIGVKDGVPNRVRYPDVDSVH